MINSNEWSGDHRHTKIVLVAVVLVLLSGTMLDGWLVIPVKANPRTIHVDISNIGDPDEDGSLEHPFDKIQEGVDAASSGDIVDVASGIYYENVEVSKSRISLVGENGGSIIDGNGTGQGIRVKGYPPDFVEYLTISGFTIQNCAKGLTLVRCRNVYLRNNSMIENVYNFADYSLQVNDVDTSNTVDEKPIYYWVNQHDKQVPADAGYVAVIGSRKIVVKNLNLTSNGQGILFKNTTGSLIENVRVSNNSEGIYLDVWSDNNIIANNTVSNNAIIGVYVSTSSGNVISGNKISKSDYGIFLASSGNFIENNELIGNRKGLVLFGQGSSLVSGNIVRGNMLSNNTVGVSTRFSLENIIYHNNFVNNENQTESFNGVDVWDYLGEGNYWSDYVGGDESDNGIGDTPYLIDEDNRDNYPLMGLYKDYKVMWQGTAYHLASISNSVISELSLSQPEKSISFYVFSTDDGMDFCRVTIPEVLLGGPYKVLIDDLPPVTVSEESNGTHAFLFFTYYQGNRRVKIFGETVIPEFPTAFFLSLLMVATLLIVVLRRLNLLNTSVRG